MTLMFCHCEVFDKDVAAWNTASVTSMASTFQFCHAFSGQGIGAWNTSSVTNMKCMFRNCRRFDADISALDAARKSIEIASP